MRNRFLAVQILSDKNKLPENRQLVNLSGWESRMWTARSYHIGSQKLLQVVHDSGSNLTAEGRELEQYGPYLKYFWSPVLCLVTIYNESMAFGLISYHCWKDQIVEVADDDCEQPACFPRARDKTVYQPGWKPPTLPKQKCLIQSCKCWVLSTRFAYLRDDVNRG